MPLGIDAGNGRLAHGSVKVRRMEYRGKQYSVVQGIDGNWKWLVSDLVGHTKSGKAENHAAGVKAAQHAIDKALAPKMERLRLRAPIAPPRDLAATFAFVRWNESPIALLFL
jgi:hypothetical protein